MSLMITTAAAHADPMGSAADNWVENLAAKESEDILRQIEKKIKLDPDLKKNLKDSVKGYLKDKLKKSFFPSAHSLGMQEIIDSIETKLAAKSRRKLCDTAAVNQAWWAANDVRRQLTGAAEAFVDLLGSMGGVGSLAKDLAEKAAKTLGKKILDKVRKALEDALDDYIKNYKVETFTRDFSTGSCSMTMRVIWNKKKGKFNYVILGNCNCKKISLGGGRSVLLEKWSVTGHGKARWVGEEQERKNKKKSDSISAVRGSALTYSAKVKSVCCGSDGTACAVPPSQNPWIFLPSGGTKTTGKKPRRPTTGTSGKGGGTKVGSDPKPTRPTVPTNPVSGVPMKDEKGGIKIPEIPSGPLCPSDKEKVIQKASDAYRRAVESAAAKQRDYDIARDSGKDQAKKDSAKSALDKANGLKKKAGEALEKAYTIPEKKTCHPTHESQSMTLPDSSSAYPDGEQPALAMNVNGPKSCRAGRSCRYSLILTNEGSAQMYGALPIAISTTTQVRSVTPRTKGWYCLAGRAGTQCYTKHLNLAPEEFTGLELDINFASTSRTSNVDVCFNPAAIWSGPESGPERNRSNIQLLQVALAKAGYKPGPADGQMGRRTIRAAQRYARGNFCQVPEPLSEDMLASLLGGEIIDAIAENACSTTQVTANRKPARKKSSSGSNWPGVILQYGIQRELHRRQKRDREKRHEKYKSEPKVEPKEEYYE